MSVEQHFNLIRYSERESYIWKLAESDEDMTPSFLFE